MHAIKCVVVGNNAVGKTCLIESYANNTFPAGGCITDIQHPLVVIDGKTFQIDLWDTVVDEEYDQIVRLRPLTYLQTDVFLICFSVSDHLSFEYITNKWIPEISHHCPNTPFFIIATKDDLRYEIDVIYGYSRKYNNNIPIDVLCIIEQYVNGKDILINDQDAHQLCEKVGGYKYMGCSALKQRGLKQILYEVGQCAILHHKKKSKNCHLL